MERGVDKLKDQLKDYRYDINKKLDDIQKQMEEESLRKKVEYDFNEIVKKIEAQGKDTNEMQSHKEEHLSYLMQKRKASLEKAQQEFDVILKDIDNLYNSL